MIGPQGAKTWVEISSGAVAANIAALRSLLHPETTFCAVVKADAYGHNLRTMVRLCAENGVDHFAVDSIDEALEARSIVPRSTIFILSFTVPERLAEVVTNDFIQTVYDEETVDALGKIAQEKHRVVRVGLKVETGLHRQGVGPRGMDAVLDAIAHHRNEIKLESIASHLVSAEDASNPMNNLQMSAFTAALEHVRGRGFDPRYIHIARSAAAMLIPVTQFTMTRWGISLYGLWPAPEVRRAVVLGRQPIDLQPVLSWRTKIAQIKDVPSGKTIGYGATHLTNRPIRLAILPVGYFDGFDRRFSNRGEVLVRGRKCPVLGIVCMNMCMVDVSAVPNVQIGDTATLIGRDGMHAISADDLAATTGTINYEIVTRINPMLPRVVTS